MFSLHSHLHGECSGHMLLKPCRVANGESALVWLFIKQTVCTLRISFHPSLHPQWDPIWALWIRIPYSHLISQSPNPQIKITSATILFKLFLMGTHLSPSSKPHAHPTTFVKSSQMNNPNQKTFLYICPSLCQFTGYCQILFFSCVCVCVCVCSIYTAMASKKETHGEQGPGNSSTCFMSNLANACSASRSLICWKNTKGHQKCVQALMLIDHDE